MSNLPFVEEILADLRRFKECVEDDQDVDCGRDRLDLLTQLGLLERVQRSPALWQMSQAGEDAIAQPASGEPEQQTAINADDLPTKKYPLGAFNFAAPVAAGEPVGWIIDWPDEPELGHYFGDSPAGTGSRSRPLYAAPPAAAHGDEAVPLDLVKRAAAPVVDGEKMTLDRIQASNDLRRILADAAMRAQAGKGGEV